MAQSKIPKQVQGFKAGDTYTVNSAQNFAGILTSSKTALLFTIPVPYSLEKVSSVRWTALNGSIRSMGGYIGTANADFLTQEGMTVYAGKSGNYAVTLTINLDTATSVANNNTPVMFTSNNFSMTFS